MINFVQRGPTEWPKTKVGKENKEEVSERRAGSGALASFQTWRVNGTRCPKGTVPVRRTTVKDVLRSKSLFDFGKKKRPILLDRKIDAPDVVSGNGHEVLLFSSLFFSYCSSFFFSLKHLCCKVGGFMNGFFSFTSTLHIRFIIKLSIHHHNNNTSNK